MFGIWWSLIVGSVAGTPTSRSLLERDVVVPVTEPAIIILYLPVWIYGPERLLLLVQISTTVSRSNTRLCGSGNHGQGSHCSDIVISQVGSTVLSALTICI